MISHFSRRYSRLLFWAFICHSLISCDNGSKVTTELDYLSASRTKDGRIGLIGTDGRWVIENAFAATSRVICTDGVITEITIPNGIRYYKLVNNQLQPLFDKRYAEGSPFFDGYAIVVDAEGKLKVVSKKGEERDIQTVEGIRITRAGVFSEGLLRVRTASGKWGYLNTSGKWALQPEYTMAESFINGQARVKDTAGIVQVISKDGSVVFQGEEDMYYTEVSGSQIAKTKNRYNTDFTYEIVTYGKENKTILTSYQTVDFTPLGNATVRSLEGKYGIIDPAGKQLGELSTQFEQAPVETETGFAAADKFGLILFDKNGKNINTIPGLGWPFTFNNLYVARVKEETDQFRLVSPDGKILGTSAFYIKYYANQIDDFIQFKKGYSVASKWLDFDNIVQEALKNINSSGLHNITAASSVEEVVNLANAYKNNNIENTETVDVDNYEHILYSGKDEEIPFGEEMDNYDEEITEPADVVEMPKGVKDPYSDIPLYTYSAYTGYITGKYASYSMAITFDSYLKVDKFGYEIDPVFKTESLTFQGYQLNPDARPTQVDVDIWISNRDLFKEKMAVFLKNQGWGRGAKGVFRHPSTGNEIEFTSTGIRYRFG